MKKWLTEHFLPLWAKETVLRDNRNLLEQNRMLQQRILEQDSYIRGLHRGLRRRAEHEHL